MNNGVIFCDKRTGSTFLQEALNSHPQIVCYDEMFMKNRNRKRRGQLLYRTMKTEKNMTTEAYIRWLYDFDKQSGTLFRLMYPHNEKHNVLPVLKKMGVPIIHLIRTNGFAKSMSKQMKQKNRGDKIKINTKLLLSNLMDNEYRIWNNKRALKGANVIEIKYEKMIGETIGSLNGVKKYGAFNIKSNQITYVSDKYNNMICDFLGVDRVKLFSDVSKRNSWNLWDHIKNVNEVKNTLKNTKWEKFI